MSARTATGRGSPRVRDYGLDRQLAAQRSTSRRWALAAVPASLPTNLPIRAATLTLQRAAPSHRTVNPVLSRRPRQALAGSSPPAVRTRFLIALVVCMFTLAMFQ
jgi:hypothetical protein